MQKELEATYPSIDVPLIREKLKAVGAELVNPERLMRRYIFAPLNEDEIHGTWLRVRDEGDKTTMSIKKVAGDKIEDQEETCLIIDNFENGYEFLKHLGLTQKAYQETKRESWLLDGVEITIDTWPGLNPFLEIEGKSSESVQSVSEKLGLDYSKAIFGAVDIIYKLELGITPDQINNHTPIIKFDNPPRKENYETK